MDQSLKDALSAVDELDPLELSNSVLMPNYGPASLCLIRGEGSRVFDNQGRSYLDFLSGISVVSLGHSPAAVVQAISDQARKLMHVSNIFANEVGPKVAYLIDLLIRSEDSTLPKGKVFFANSGAEANEAAIKLARKYGRSRGKYHIVSTNGAFHGRTMGALSATGQRAKQEPFEPLVPGFTHVEWNSIDALGRAITKETVAVMLEPIQGEAGVIDPETDYLEQVSKLCADKDLLLIMDEVQTGFARTGKWFGFQHYPVVPNIVTMAKALGSGMPIGACWAGDDVGVAFAPGDHGTTFGGQPLAASAALATIKELVEIDAPQRACKRGAELEDLLGEIDTIEFISGSGLLRGIRLSQPIAKAVANRALELGLIVNPIGDSTIRIAPPIVVTSPEIEQACTILAQAISENL